jgi:hypothetical protein
MGMDKKKPLPLSLSSAKSQRGIMREANKEESTKKEKGKDEKASQRNTG